MGDDKAALETGGGTPKTLYLLRHAKSSWDHPMLADADRPLAPRGLKACDRLARYAEREQIHPELVLCSPARRARQTLERIAGSLGDPPTTIAPSLYAASPGELLRRLHDLPEPVGSAMVVGHNPGLQELAILLAGENSGAADDGFPTGALATLVFDGAWGDLEPGTACLRALVVPRQLD